MKAKLNADAPVIDLFGLLFDNIRAAKLARTLRGYNILTCEQLHGALHPYLPDLSDAALRRKGLSLTYKAARRRLSPRTRTRRLRMTLGLTEREAGTLLNAILSHVAVPARVHMSSQTAMSLGCGLNGSRASSSFWSNSTVPLKMKSTFVLPDYDRMGPVFDQGERGTCVANAATSLLDYLAHYRNSRQFAYYQAKMMDGHPNTEGTWIKTELTVLADPRIVDYGDVQEEEWPYCEHSKATVHQGPPPEVCYDTLRNCGVSPVFVRRSSVVDDIKTLLVGSRDHLPVPVIVGLRVYESFDNYYSNRSGVINLPLPGERILGGHAMLIVGYFDGEGVFLVRNSWGSRWAAQNPKGFPGHALLPYRYVREYCDSGGTLLESERERFFIPPSSRLGNRRDHRRLGQPSRKPCRSSSRKRRTTNKRLFSRITKMLSRD